VWLLPWQSCTNLKDTRQPVDWDENKTPTDESSVNARYNKSTEALINISGVDSGMLDCTYKMYMKAWYVV